MTASTTACFSGLFGVMIPCSRNTPTARSCCVSGPPRTPRSLSRRGRVGHNMAKYNGLASWCGEHVLELLGSKTPIAFFTDDLNDVANFIRLPMIACKASWRGANHMRAIIVAAARSQPGCSRLSFRTRARSEEGGPLRSASPSGYARGIGRRSLWGWPTQSMSGGSAVSAAIPWARPLKCTTRSSRCAEAGPCEVEPLHPDCHAWNTGLRKMGLLAAGQCASSPNSSPRGRSLGRRRRSRGRSVGGPVGPQTLGERT